MRPAAGASVRHRRGQCAAALAFRLDCAMGNSEVSRRAAMKTAAWSVPVIAAAAVVPAMAASEGTITLIDTDCTGEHEIGFATFAFAPRISPPER